MVYFIRIFIKFEQICFCGRKDESTLLNEKFREEEKSGRNGHKERFTETFPFDGDFDSFIQCIKLKKRISVNCKKNRITKTSREIHVLMITKRIHQTNLVVTELV